MWYWRKSFERHFTTSFKIFHSRRWYFSVNPKIIYFFSIGLIIFLLKSVKSSKKAMHRYVIKKLDHLKLKKHLSEKGRFEILLAVPSFLVDFSLRLIEKVSLLINTKIQLESNVYLVSFFTAPSQLTLFEGGVNNPLP